jgi:2,4-dienoyl-CoA reductase-like NADH-dependent reductase (Old Yellow Enzyme family)
MSISYPSLLSPLRLGNVNLPNRIVMAPAAPATYPNEQFAGWRRVQIRFTAEGAAPSCNSRTMGGIPNRRSCPFLARFSGA